MIPFVGGREFHNEFDRVQIELLGEFSEWLPHTVPLVTAVQVRAGLTHSTGNQQVGRHQRKGEGADPLHDQHTLGVTEEPRHDQDADHGQPAAQSQHLVAERDAEQGTHGRHCTAGGDDRQSRSPAVATALQAMMQMPPVGRVNAAAGQFPAQNGHADIQQGNGHHHHRRRRQGDRRRTLQRGANGKRSEEQPNQHTSGVTQEDTSPRQIVGQEPQQAPRQNQA